MPRADSTPGCAIRANINHRYERLRMQMSSATDQRRGSVNNRFRAGPIASRKEAQSEIYSIYQTRKRTEQPILSKGLDRYLSYGRAKSVVGNASGSAR